jgi:hypothetical protein
VDITILRNDNDSSLPARFRGERSLDCRLNEALPKAAVD